MQAEIIAVGNEIVFGHTVNTNGSYLARKIREVGILPSYHTAICDEEEKILEALKIASSRAEVILLTGGLGPTPDDLTKEVVCSFLEMPLKINEKECEKIRQYFLKIGKEMPKNNEKQAAFPKEAVLLDNHHGTAPGCILEKDGITYILLPGPPKEMQPMFEESVLPYLKAKCQMYVQSIDIHCFGIGEGELAERIASMIGEYEWGSIATYVSDHEVVVRLMVCGNERATVKALLEKKKQDLKSCLANYIIGYNDDKLEDELAKMLIARKLTVGTAESCTGGLVAATLINCSGISACIGESIVTYSNEAKMKYVHVKKETLDRVGAVSEETAREMAEGIRKASGSDIGLSTTGIAGPGGGTPEKPVGLVYIGIATKEGTDVYRLMLNGTRREVREKTVKHILFHLYQKLCENNLLMS